MRKLLLCAAGLLGGLGLASLSAPADEAAKGKMIPATFRAYLVTDGRFPPVKAQDGKETPDPRNRAEKIHCLVCENGLAPVIAIFVRADPKTLPGKGGLADLVGRVNDVIPKHRSDKLASFVIFLRLEGGGPKTVTVKTIQPDKSEVETKVEQDLEFPDEDLEKREKTVAGIKDFADAVKAPNVPMGLAATETKAVKAWGIDDSQVTVMVYHRMRMVHEPWKFAKADAIPEEAINEIIQAAIASIGGDNKQKK